MLLWLPLTFVQKNEKKKHGWIVSRATRVKTVIRVSNVTRVLKNMFWILTFAARELALLADDRKKWRDIMQSLSKLIQASKQIWVKANVQTVYLLYARSLFGVSWCSKFLQIFRKILDIFNQNSSSFIKPRINQTIDKVLKNCIVNRKKYAKFGQ